MTTIFAQATGAARSAIAIIRVSGPDVRAILENLAGGVPAPRRASLRHLRAADGETIDHGVVLFWAAPASYTGEDCAELQVHGGQAVLHGISQALRAAGARPAEPGEFTRRAVLNGRIDLLEAEGVADLIAAETEAQRRLALRQLQGAQSAVLAGWAERLRRILAWQEALIDFPDEDLPASAETELHAEITSLANEFAASAHQARQGMRVREGMVVAIIGAPNVGKSSLINLLAQRDVAITSPIAGTTRDALEVWLQIAGVGVTLIDTAGLRETDDPVEAEGVRRARLRAAQADLVLHVGEAACMQACRPSNPDTILVANKVDLAVAPMGCLGVSALTGEGIDALRATLETEVLRLTEGAASPILSRVRHESALAEASACLFRAGASEWPELRGEELRLAMRALGRITGEVGVEDVLDTIFSAFCIGK